MKDYIRYEIGVRKYSSNIVLGVYLKLNKDTGKMEEEKEKLIAPITAKMQGDDLAQRIVYQFNSQNY